MVISEGGTAVLVAWESAGYLGIGIAVLYSPFLLTFLAMAAITVASDDTSGASHQARHREGHAEQEADHTVRERRSGTGNRGRPARSSVLPSDTGRIQVGSEAPGSARRHQTGEPLKSVGPVSLEDPRSATWIA